MSGEEYVRSVWNEVQAAAKGAMFERFSHDDTLWAVLLSYIVQKVNEVALDSPIAVGFVDGPSPKPSEFITYAPRIEGRQEEVCLIFIPEIAQRLEETIKELPRMFTPEGTPIPRWIFKLRVFPHQLEYLFMVAAHEMRHRIQFTFPANLTLFSFSFKESLKDTLTRNIVNFLHEEFLKGQRTKQRRCKQELFEPKEFDAKIVELLVMHRWRLDQPVDHLRPLLWAQPDV